MRPALSHSYSAADGNIVSEEKAASVCIIAYLLLPLPAHFFPFCTFPDHFLKKIGFLLPKIRFLALIS